MGSCKSGGDGSSAAGGTVDRVNETIVEAFEATQVAHQIIRLGEEGDPGSFYVVAANQAACDALGLNLKADIGKPWRETSPELAASEFGSMFVKALVDQKLVTWDVEYGDSKFEKNWWRGMVKPIDDRTLIMTFENVTEQKLTLLELERSNRELEDFAYVASHDLKAPLRDIQNLAKWVSEDLKDVPAETAAHLETMRGRVKRMEKLLGDLLAYSRAGRRYAKPETFALRSVFDDMRELLPQDERFTVEFEPTDIELTTPRQPLETLLRNLLTNALKHHDKDAGKVVVSCKASDKHVELAVSDDGPGIPDEFAERVFRMFTTLKPRDEVEGSGMGLAVCRKLAEAYGQSLWLEPSEGRGATFRFTWPRDWDNRSTSHA